MQHTTVAMPALPSAGIPIYQDGQIIQAQVIHVVKSDAPASNTNHVPQAANITTIPLQEPEAADIDKRAIYRHPLFPLVAMLFEKCEQATSTPDCPPADSFDVDIHAFVHQQEQDVKPFFSDDPDLDNLMVKAIQVLRIHLLELEKVNELCKDFCNRYVSCLKGKLQSDNLLRVEGEDLSPSPPLHSPGIPPMPNTPVQQPQTVTSVGSVMIQQSVSQPAASVATLNQGQIVSGGTVYQMVQTPQGIVAQPIQIQTVPQMTPQVTTASVIHGSTPLSQIGVPTTPVAPLTPTCTMTTMGNLSATPLSPLSDGEDSGRKDKNNKRGVLPKQATQVMKSWLFQHIVHPYPTEDEKRQIAGQTNLSLLQVNNWFINARRRILQPMLDASNPDQTKVKKTKPQNRPVQRFWPENIANIQPKTTSAQQEAAKGGQVQQAQILPLTQGQQIIIPASAIVTADGQILNATTTTVNYVQQLPGTTLSPMLGQVQHTTDSPALIVQNNDDSLNNSDSGDVNLVLDHSGNSDLE
ncbi:homeobox protein PKNOX1-like [Lineus longissimus]|uniref:homeobox protein PKNOX1-like n=1 Tax=Lineus longissimus TaxID=88925 RepID=UPI002B4CA466